MLYFYIFLYLFFYLIPAFNNDIKSIELTNSSQFIVMVIATLVPFLSGMLITRPKLKIIPLKDLGLLCLLLITMLGVSFLCGLLWPVKIDFNINSNIQYVILTILVASNEELFFRVLPHHLLSTRKLSIQLTTSSILFAMAHFSYGLNGVLQSFALSVVLYLCYFYKKNYLLNVIVHALFNLTIYFLNRYFLL